jgi:hypothetical protein
MARGFGFWARYPAGTYWIPDDEGRPLQGHYLGALGYRVAADAIVGALPVRESPSVYSANMGSGAAPRMRGSGGKDYVIGVGPLLIPLGVVGVVA